MSLMVGRISYLPDDNKVRQIRISESTKAFSYLKDMLKDKEIRMVAQNYTQEEVDTLLKEQKVTLHKPLKCGGARNVLLREFYASDYDYLLMLDDDISFYDYYDAGQLFKELDTRPEKFVNADVMYIKAIEPQYTPFKKVNENLPMSTDFVFCQAAFTNGQGNGILLNLKKYFGKEIYFDESLETGEREDLKFIYEMQLAVPKLRILECRALVQRNYCNDGAKSTIYAVDNIQRTANDAMQNMANRLGIPVVNGRVQFAKVFKTFKGYLKIKRDVKWEGEMAARQRKPKMPRGGLL